MARFLGWLLFWGENVEVSKVGGFFFSGNIMRAGEAVVEKLCWHWRGTATHASPGQTRFAKNLVRRLPKLGWPSVALANQVC